MVGGFDRVFDEVNYETSEVKVLAYDTSQNYRYVDFMLPVYGCMSG